MIKNIARGYCRLFASAGKVLLLLALCVSSGCIIVFPLWKFATSAPNIYSIAIIALIACLLMYALIRKIRTAGFRFVFFASLRILLITATLASCFILVIQGKRFFAIPVIILFVILYGILSFGIKGSAQ